MTAKQKLESKIFAFRNMYRMTDEMEKDLWDGIKDFAKEKCRKQREIIQLMNPHHTDYTNAPEPNLD